MPAKSASRPRFSSSESTRDGAGLRERLDHLHAGHDRVAGKVPRAVLVGHALERDDARARIELDDLVQEQKGRAVGEDLFDCLPPEGGRRGHAAPSVVRSGCRYRVCAVASVVHTRSSIGARLLSASSTARAKAPWPPRTSRRRDAAGSGEAGTRRPERASSSRSCSSRPCRRTRLPELSLVAGAAVAEALAAETGVRDDGQASERRARRRAQGRGHPRGGRRRPRRARRRRQRVADARRASRRRLSRRRSRSRARRSTEPSCSQRSSSGSRRATTAGSAQRVRERRRLVAGGVARDEAQRADDSSSARASSGRASRSPSRSRPLIVAITVTGSDTRTVSGFSDTSRSSEARGRSTSGSDCVSPADGQRRRVGAVRHLHAARGRAR